MLTSVEMTSTVPELFGRESEAAQLFVWVRTVEANLSSIYAKPDLRSRSELAGRIGSVRVESASARPDARQ